ncbi:YdcF family protein [Oceanirhabdus sp. W0125-5]|uniref:YdcF family protein n=1 Tax=Oceanirhabdus sp. W0125-5 TaxID=2999116 RepID=UPI0022F2C283|nr:YdcF family protein [Oceanirhabdus sp. W0125-5]WBW95194.1 YdcF family protein [Oceanirhabdus sp. W0125-5]
MSEFKERLYKYFSILLIVLGILNMAYCLFGFSLGWGFYLGLKLFVFIGIVFITHGLLRLFNKKYKKNLLNKIVTFGISLFIVSFVIIQCMISYQGDKNNLSDMDYVIILGTQVIGDRPGLELKNRLDKAIRIINDNQSCKIIVCGGTGYNQKFSEAYVMKKYLIEKGIDNDRILKEEKSTNTYENIKNANDIIRNIDNRDNIKVGVCSNDYHVYRGKIISKKFELNPVGIYAKTPLYIIPNHRMREYCSILYYWLFLR